MRTIGKKHAFGSLGSLLALFVLTGTALGNGLTVTNFLFAETVDGLVDVQFDVAWANSWRATWDDTSATPAITVTNWDAAWVFIKWRPNGGEWRHATLAATGHTAPEGAQIDVAGDKVGAFIYRSVNGSGNVNYSSTKLRWDRVADKASTLGTNTIDISVNAIEMVYVPQGAFWAGNTNGVIANSFRAQSVSNSPFRVDTEGAFTIYWGTAPSSTALPANFPKGYNAFYCMKYEITEGQWVDFFNTLSDAQKTERDITGNDTVTPVQGGKNSDAVVSRNTVAWDHTIPSSAATSQRRNRACGYVSWADGCALLDWSGLRPMSELEFEKACRGPLEPVEGEYAWGTATIMADASRSISGTEDGTETVTSDTSAGGCCYGNRSHTGGDAGYGPLRAGIFAKNGSTRVSAGASYWGIMELSGNLWEELTGCSAAATFTGLHGDGVLDVTGDANVTGWPGKDAVGEGDRGGPWGYAATMARVADRTRYAAGFVTRHSYGGPRGVRTAP